MVFRAGPALTRITFRRDVRLFIGLLAGYFILLVAVLLALLQSGITDTQEAIANSQDLIADSGAAELRRVIGAFGDSTFDTNLLALRARFPVNAVEVRMDDGRARRSGHPLPGDQALERRVGPARATFYFDGSAMEAVRWRFRIILIVVSVATMAVTILLLLYVRHILRPIEEMLGEARQLEPNPADRDEASYLIETFRNSISTLKAQEIELKRLHDIEKNRADDLETITSTLTRSLTSGFLAFGTDHRILEMNGAAREILDVAPERSVGGLTLRELLGDISFANEIMKMMESGEPAIRRELELPRSEGPAKVIGLTTVRLVNESGRFLGTLALFTDLTQVRRLEDRVREMQNLADLGVMSAGIAHEFRNSLSTILGFIRLARRSELPDQVVARLTSAETEAGELANAVSSLLQFARPMHLQPGPVDLAEITRGVIDRLAPSASAVAFDLHLEPLTVNADASLLARAIENVLRNAIEATADRPGPAVTVTISAEPVPAIEIRDNGVGIEEKETPNLFLPFHSTKPGGVGMGLPLARKIVLLHGGTISIHSRPGEGTTVRIELLEVLQNLPHFAQPQTA
jgi:nitrogen fixation/metabolism regulation signal transduction histidine kinase